MQIPDHKNTRLCRDGWNWTQTSDVSTWLEQVVCVQATLRYFAENILGREEDMGADTRNPDKEEKWQREGVQEESRPLDR